MIEVGGFAWVDPRGFFSTNRNEDGDYWLVGRVIELDVDGTNLVRVEIGLCEHTIKARGQTFRTEAETLRLVTPGHVEPINVVDMIGLLDQACPFCVDGLLAARTEIRDTDPPWDVVGYAVWTATGWSDKTTHRRKPMVCRCAVPLFVTGNDTTLTVSVDAAVNSTTFISTTFISTNSAVSLQLQGRRLRRSGRRRPGLAPEEARRFRAQSRALARRPPNAR